MAKVSYDVAMTYNDTNDSGEGRSRVKFFNIKNGEEAVVRILCDSTADFDIHTVHNVVTPQAQYGKRMNCLRSPEEPIDKCPLCAANKPLTQKMYVKIIHYTMGQNGTIVPVAKVWERSVQDRNFGARALAKNIENYGPLSDIICKIIRSGDKLNTEYQFIPNLNPQVYPPNIYVKDTSLFEGFSPLGSMITDKTAEEYNVFLTTGQFPARAKTDNNSQATPRTYTPSYEPPVNVPPTNGQPTYTVPAQNATVPAYQQHPVDSGAPQYGTPPFDPTQTVYNNPVNNPQVAPTNTPPRNPWDNPTPQTGFERPRRY